MLTAVHNNVRCLSIASLPFFLSRFLSAPGYSSPFWIKVQPEVSTEMIWNGDAGRAPEAALFEIGTVVYRRCPGIAFGA
jgi:hypothetical protein